MEDAMRCPICVLNVETNAFLAHYTEDKDAVQRILIENPGWTVRQAILHWRERAGEGYETELPVLPFEK
ncbi:MAG: hypothetical protein EXS64_20575 [Candidatus Latescibacteria bacterium]|nr:hypothetical protein [Candidatus Latescibacterota bacterium]